MTPMGGEGTSSDELDPWSPKCVSPIPQVPSVFSLKKHVLLRMVQKGTLTYPITIMASKTISLGLSGVASSLRQGISEVGPKGHWPGNVGIHHSLPSRTP